jgi:hypothetical protein
MTGVKWTNTMSILPYRRQFLGRGGIANLSLLLRVRGVKLSAAFLLRSRLQKMISAYIA